MNSSRNWMLIFPVGIGILVIAPVSLVLTNLGGEAAPLQENTPVGTGRTSNPRSSVYFFNDS